MEGAALGIGIAGLLLPNMVLLLDSYEPILILCEPIDAEFLVVLEVQLANNRAERDLRRLNVHLVQNLFHLHHHFAVSKDDNRVRTLISNELRVADRDRFRGSIHRLRR